MVRGFILVHTYHWHSLLLRKPLTDFISNAIFVGASINVAAATLDKGVS